MAELKSEIIKLERDGREVEIHVLSKGRSAVKPEDIESYKEKVLGLVSSDNWRLPNDGLKKIFLMDLQMGLEFCTKKYGVSKANIIKEAARLAPSFKITKD
jgi:hypothetical protein